MKKIGIVITEELVRRANEFCPNDEDRMFTPTHCPAALAMREQVSEKSLVGIITASIDNKPCTIPQRLSNQITRWVETSKFRPGVYPVEVPDEYASK